MATSNFGWNTPALGSENNVPADMASLAQQIDTSLRAATTELTFGAATTYTPTWTQTDNTPLSIGNGTLTGRYIQRGKWVWFAISLIRGSTTNFGNTHYVFTLPVAPRFFAWVQGSGFVTAGSAEFPIAGVRGIGANRIVVFVPAGRVSSTVPGGWIAGNEIFISGFYEAS